MNASQGTRMNQTNTDQAYYQPFGIEYHGIPAVDIFTFKLSPYFKASADFIEDALSKEGWYLIIYYIKLLKAFNLAL